MENPEVEKWNYVEREIPNLKRILGKFHVNQKEF